MMKTGRRLNLLYPTKNPKSQRSRKPSQTQAMRNPSQALLQLTMKRKMSQRKKLKEKREREPEWKSERERNKKGTSLLTLII